MTTQANFRERVRVNSITHIHRNLVGEGKILVKVGTEVTPADIIGKSVMSAGYFTVNIAKGLGLPAAQCEKYLVRRGGETIFRGELLAKRKSLLGEKLVISPGDGKLESFDPKRGELLLRYLPKIIPLTAGVTGIVDYVDTQNQLVLIKTLVTEIYGMFGCGYQRIGIINVINSANVLTNKEQINPSMSKQILVTGALIYGETLRKAASIGVSGIVTGGLNARDFKAMSGSLGAKKRMGTDFGMSVVVTEGFGSMPIGLDIYAIIKNHHGRFGFINGNTNRLLLPSADPDSIITLRKIVLPVNKEPESFSKVSVKDIVVGDKVRVVWPPFAGSQGTVIGIDQSSTLLPSGVSTYFITIETPSRKLKVPYLNVEIV